MSEDLDAAIDEAREMVANNHNETVAAAYVAEEHGLDAYFDRILVAVREETDA